MRTEILYIQRRLKSVPERDKAKLYASRRDARVRFLAMSIAVLGIENILMVFMAGFLHIQPHPLVSSFNEAGTFLTLMTGLFLVFISYKLLKRERLFWSVTIIFIVFSLFSNGITGAATNLINIALDLLLLAFALLIRKDFSEMTHGLNTQHIAGLTSLAITLIYGILGCMALGTQFSPQINTWDEAIYFTLTTLTTVGYGDIHAVTGQSRLFVSSLLVFGVSSFLYAITVSFLPLVERKIKQVLNVLENVMKNMNNHIIICGVCDETLSLVAYLKSEGIDLVILAPKESVRDEIIKMGVYIMEGDPSEEELLKRAKIDQARAIIAASTNDAQDVLIILTAKHLKEDITAVALATSAENKKKLYQVGADVVISPRIIGGRLLAKAALGEEMKIDL